MKIFKTSFFYTVVLCTSKVTFLLPISAFYVSICITDQLTKNQSAKSKGAELALVYQGGPDILGLFRSTNTSGEEI